MSPAWKKCLSPEKKAVCSGAHTALNTFIFMNIYLWHNLASSPWLKAFHHGIWISHGRANSNFVWGRQTWQSDPKLPVCVLYCTIMLKDLLFSHKSFLLQSIVVSERLCSFCVDKGQ
jgi:hypothetical protein